MKKNCIIYVCFFVSFLYAQNPKIYTHYIELGNKNKPVFKKVNNKLAYTGNDSKQKQIFSKSNLMSFELAFPHAIDPYLSKIYTLKTTSVNMVKELKKNCKETYKYSEDITDSKMELLYYPNDYGSTSPVSNLGVNIARSDLDYHQAPIAWNVTKGKPDIKIGISDTGIKYNLSDLSNKVELARTYYSSDDVRGYSHGTSVAALAAARGDNAHGSVGVCMDCNIISGGTGIPYYGTIENPTLLSDLYKMALAGARVINMSWCDICNQSSPTGYAIAQAVINDIVNNYNVTLVAAAGNYTSFSSPNSFHSRKNSSGTLTGVPMTPFGTLYSFPASYDNVISVSSICHQNPINLPLNNQQSTYCCNSPFYPIHSRLEDSVSSIVDASNPMNPIGVIKSGYYNDQYNPDGLIAMHTLNEKVDLLASGYFNIFDYSSYINGGTLFNSGTSFSAPMVSGTIGLMLSVDKCLKPKEIESILKLTAKDIESMNMNSFFKGYVGAGRLETGKAVKFVEEMMKPDGNSVIENHIFNRFDYVLPRVNNRLTLQNVEFRGSTTANFVSKNTIEILDNSDFVPNNFGVIDLIADTTMDRNCLPVIFARKNQKTDVIIIEDEIDKNAKSVSLEPNPNNGVFSIHLSGEAPPLVSYKIYDIAGNLIYSSVSKNAFIEVNLPNIASGLYIVKLEGEGYEESLKFIKE